MSKKRGMQPFTSVDEAVRKNTFDEWRGRPANTIGAERDTIERDMERAFEQSGSDLDLSKIDCINGKTLAEKCETLVHMHSQLSGLEDALRERNELDEVARGIRDRNRGGGATENEYDETAYSRPGQPPLLSNEFFAELHQSGQSLASISKSSGVSVELQMSGQDILNTVFKTTSGWAPDVERRPGYVPSAQRPIQVIDVFPQFPTNQSAINYNEETIFTSGATEKGEGVKADESTLQLTDRTDNVREIVTEIPVTRVQLEDEDQVRAYIDQRLLFMLRQGVDGKILNGNGTAPNISGLLSRSNLSNQEWTQDASNNLTNALDALKYAKTKVAVTGRAMPSDYIINHATWDECSLSQSLSGGYNLGNPRDDFGERIWGLPITLSDHLDSDTASDTVNALVGDFRNFAALFIRRDFTIDVGFSGDDFSNRQIRIQATVRVALSVYRPQAFCTISRP